MERGIPPADDAEAERRAPYQRLVQRIRDHRDAIPMDPGWEDRSMARWLAARRRRRIRTALGIVALLLGIVAVVFLLTSLA